MFTITQMMISIHFMIKRLTITLKEFESLQQTQIFNHCIFSAWCVNAKHFELRCYTQTEIIVLHICGLENQNLSQILNSFI